MYKSSVVDFLGSQRKVAKLLRVSDQAISNWGDVIPERAALLLEKLTNGDLKYDPSLYSDSYASEPEHSGVAE